MTAVRKPDQVAELVRARIRAGEFRPGMLAPSGPELAKELGLAAMTAAGTLTKLGPDPSFIFHPSPTRLVSGTRCDQVCLDLSKYNFTPR